MKGGEAPYIITIESKSGQQLFLQRIHEDDGWSLCDFVATNEDRLITFFPKTREANLTPDLSKRFAKIKSKEFDQKEEFLFTIKPKDSRSIVGMIYLKELDWKKKQGELAYCIDYKYEGQGITTQLIQDLSGYAFEQLDVETLQIITHKSNISSVKVAEKSNFTWVKTLSKSFTPPNGKPLDMELYELYK
jgi:ribosomal-protein-alanine N-acetyltransferase